MSWAWQNTRLYTMGPQFTYKQINTILNKYQRKYRRKWKRADYMACWNKVKHGVEMRHGWHCCGSGRGYFRAGQRLMLLFPDGRVTVSANLSNPYERTRFNHYFPYRDKWQMWWYRDGLILSRNEDFDNGYVISPRYYSIKNHVRSRYIEFDKHGELITPIKSMMRFKEYKKRKIRESNERAKPRRRGWYWTRRARNLYHDRSKCVSRTPWNERTHNGWERYQCHADIRQPPQTFKCGCRTYRKVYKRKFNKTVDNIFTEQNATVRSAWIQIYGVQKFFEDADAIEIDKHDNYRLLRLETADTEDTEAESRVVVALKMVCPTTGTVYINAVPDNISSVGTALNWIYNVGDYFGTVGAQT